MNPSPRLEPAAEPRIVYSCGEFAVVEKPAHLLVHPTRPTGERTLLDFLREGFPDTESVSFVNRLDRETSGLVLAALCREAASELGKLMMARRIAKGYLALVHGTPNPAEGTIDAPLARLGIGPDNPVYLRRGVVPGGEPARTDYALRASGGGISLVELSLHTGRLHQIRVHLAHIGCPVVGDKLYGPDPRLYLRFIEEGWSPALAERLLLPRHALHAWQLGFEWRGTPLLFTTDPPLAADLAAFAAGFGVSPAP